MFTLKSKYHLGDLFNIPIYVDISLVFLLILFATGGSNLFFGLAMALMLLVSITAHEFGHALTARAFGYETRDITLSLLGGCASLIAMPRKASQEFLTAIAGPAVSFALAMLGVVGVAAVSYGSFVDAWLYVLSETLNVFYIPVEWGSITVMSNENLRLIEFFFSFSMMNGMLGFFNMLPGFPLDGGRVFRSAMRTFMSRAKATYMAMIVGRGVAVLIGLRGLFSLFHGGSWGFVSILIAWMIWKEGYREYQLARMESSWDFRDFRAHVSPPPYGGDDDDCDVTRNR
ncbi:MAG: M50 family metallopeptidase [Kiritimatiellia bacterium]